MSSPTAIPKPSAVVVMVGGPADLIGATRQAAGMVAAAVELAELGSAATVVATHRPFALVMSEDVYAFDGAEFDALARDVGATLIRVDTVGGSRQKYERTLLPKLGQALRKRGG